MAYIYPYTTTSQGLINTIQQLRTSFPSQVTTETLKKWSIAPQNESTVLNVLRFLGIIDEKGKRNEECMNVFVEHDDKQFAEKFSHLVKTAYHGLFDTWGDSAWSLDQSKFMTFFRTSDKSTERIGKQQTATFRTLATISGQVNTTDNTTVNKRSVSRSPNPRKKPKPTSDRKNDEIQQTMDSVESPIETKLQPKSPPALHINIQVHISPESTPEQLDQIFASMAKHFKELM